MVERLGDDGDAEARFRAHVERPVKGELGPDVEFLGPSSQSSCSGPPSGRAGILLYTGPDNRYRFSSCGASPSPDVLLAAAEPLPRPVPGDAPIAYVLTESREARVLAIDGRGRIVARAPGTPDPYGQLGICPGGDRIAVASRDEPRLTIHDARTLAVLDERSLPQSAPVAITFRCMSGDGGQVLVVAAGPGGRDGIVTAVVHDRDSASTVWEGEAASATVSADGSELAVAAVAERGYEIRLVHTGNRSTQTVGVVAEKPERMTMAGSTVILTAAVSEGSNSAVRVTRLRPGRRAVSEHVGADGTHGEPFAFGDGRIGIPVGGQRELQVFDERLRHVGTWPDAASTWGTFAVGDSVISTDAGFLRVADLHRPGGAAVLADLQHITYGATAFAAPTTQRVSPEPINPPEPAATTVASPPTTGLAAPPIDRIVTPTVAGERAGRPGPLVPLAAALLVLVAVATGVQTRRRGARR